MLREENEGYSKLLIEVLDEEMITEDSLVVIIENIFALIGHFDLDPNRVLDIILKSYESNPFNQNYIEIIKKFKVEAIPNLLTLRFHSLHWQETITENTYIVIAQLIKSNIITLENVWPSLKPSDSDFQDQFIRKNEIAFGFYKENFIVKLTQDTEDKKSDKENHEKLEIEYQRFHNDNQKLCLMNSLVKLNQFSVFEKLAVIYKPILDLSMHEELLDNLCLMVEWVLEPLVQEFNPSKHLKSRIRKEFNFSSEGNEDEINPISNLSKDDCLKDLYRLLKILGPCIGHSSLAFVKTCRFLKYLVTKKDFPLDSQIKNALGRSLLPGICYFSSNSAVATEFWAIFNHLPHYDRYKFYEDIATEDIFSCSKLVFNSSIVLRKTNKWLNRLSKDKLKQNSRSIGKFSHNNPFIVFHEFVKRVKSYPNQISSLISANSYSSALSQDIIIFFILRHLSDIEKTKLNKVDALLEQWLLNIANYAGNFLKKNYSVDLMGFFTYICQRLLKHDVNDVILLKEIFSKMSGCESFESLNKEQIQGLAGGPYLQMEVTSMTLEFRRFFIISL